MKKSLVLLLCLALCLTAGCGGKAPESTAPESAAPEEPKDITVCLDWTPNTNHTGLYVAAAKGFYEEAGLNVTIVQPPEDGATALVAAGQAQFGVTAQDSLASAFALEEPLPVTAVAALLQHNTSGIISRAGEGMDRPAGLEGKEYATWNSPIELAMMEFVMKADGADFSKLKLIPNNITDEPGALAAHQADAIWVYYGWGGITAQIRDFDFDFFYFKDFDPVMDYYTPVLIAGNAFLEEEPEAACSFLAATAKGYEYAIENPEEAAQILIDGDTTGSLAGSEELVLESQKWMSTQYKAEVEQWGYIDPARWDGFYTWLTENNLCAMPLEPGTGFSNDYLA
ncbi:MAG: ABC transporter substrate-binding protein [Candidatus Heteroscillospira sp.]|jgi:ABC-type nitrate/sulfonate/bicarbonate transport system substrate-binding protein